MGVCGNGSKPIAKQICSAKQPDFSFSQQIKLAPVLHSIHSTQSIAIATDEINHAAHSAVQPLFVPFGTVNRQLESINFKSRP